MHHLIICREYPPTIDPPGGIGTYAHHIARLLAEAGDVVHVLAQRSLAAPLPLEAQCGERLIIHRLAIDGAPPRTGLPDDPAAAVLEPHRSTIAALAHSPFPAQAFAYQVALVAEELVASAGIDAIEAPEWEAPLYHFQLRRALGLGPARQPPCIVHLHSPTEFIFRFNEWETSRPDYLPAKRFEDYTIAAADALLCPSRYLAAQAESHYGLDPNSVSVIPLPIGDTTPLDRTPEVWARGTVCFVGRLEPRKGALEWVDAAVQVAAEEPHVRFDFVGADLGYVGGLSVRDYAKTRIPRQLRARFTFHDSRPRAELRELLACAWASVVPSRWENFPNTCVEAMGSGLPVIASPAGGMAEMVEDGRSGWIAASSAPEDLAAALRRAIATGPAQRAAMGAAAVARIHAICDNAAIVARHREVRHAAVSAGATRSVALPCALAWQGRQRAGGARQLPPHPVPGGTVVVVSARQPAPDLRLLERCLASVDAQTEPAVARVLAVSPGAPESMDVVNRARASGWTVVAHRGLASAASAALSPAALAPGAAPLAVAFLGGEDVIAPTLVARCAAVLRDVREVGVVSPWVEVGHRKVAGRPYPAFPEQLLDDAAGPISVFRASALHEAGGVRATAPREYELWDAANAVLAAGWLGVTYPAVLATRTPVPNTPVGWAAALAGRERARRQLLERVPDVVAHFASELVVMLESRVRWAQMHQPRGGPTPDDDGAGAVLRSSIAAQVGLLRWATNEPGRAARWVARLGSRAVRRIVDRDPTPVQPRPSTRATE